MLYIYAIYENSHATFHTIYENSQNTLCKKKCIDISEIGRQKCPGVRLKLSKTNLFIKHKIKKGLRRKHV